MLASWCTCSYYNGISSPWRHEYFNVEGEAPWGGCSLHHDRMISSSWQPAVKISSVATWKNMYMPIPYGVWHYSLFYSFKSPLFFLHPFAHADFLRPLANLWHSVAKQSVCFLFLPSPSRSHGGSGCGSQRSHRRGHESQEDQVGGHGRLPRQPPPRSRRWEWRPQLQRRWGRMYCTVINAVILRETKKQKRLTHQYIINTSKDVLVVVI